jgi:hypothetical protein
MMTFEREKKQKRREEKRREVKKKGPTLLSLPPPLPLKKNKRRREGAGFSMYMCLCACGGGGGGGGFKKIFFDHSFLIFLFVYFLLFNELKFSVHMLALYFCTFRPLT